MARSGTTYSRAISPYANGTVLTATQLNAEADDIAQALTDSFTRAETSANARLLLSDTVVPRLSTANTWAAIQTFSVAPVFSEQAASRSALGLGSLATASTVNNSSWSGAALSVGNGGTGATDAGGARSALGLGSLATASTVNNSSWSGAALAVGNGGTGATDAGGARSALGLGSLATASSINNGNWSGTALAVGNGGTGATDAGGARSNLGIGNIATRSITIQSGGSPSGGSDGDICLIY